jgi:hypothetical protein
VEEIGNRARICSDELFYYPVSPLLPTCFANQVCALSAAVAGSGRQVLPSACPQLDSLVESAELLVSKDPRIGFGGLPGEEEG